MIAIQSLSSRQGVWFRALCGGQHRHNKDRASRRTPYKRGKEKNRSVNQP